MTALTRRHTTTTGPRDVPVFDVDGRSVRKGALVRVTCVNGDQVTGTLTGVTHRDGVAYTVDVWDGGRNRSAYASTLVVLAEVT